MKIDLNDYPKFRKLVRRTKDKFFDWRSKFSSRAVGVYIGWQGHWNLGDDALYCVVKNVLKSRMLLRGVDDPSIDEEEFKKRKYDAYLLGGGTLINKSEFLKIISGLLMSPQTKDKVFKYSLGTGVASSEFWIDYLKDPRFSFDVNSKWVEILSSFDKVAVRGNLSKQALVDYGLREDAIEVVGDLGLMLACANMKPKSLSRLNSLVGLSFGYCANMLWGKDESSIILKMIEVIKELLLRGDSVVLMPVSKEDFKLAKQIKQTILSELCGSKFASRIGVFFSLDAVEYIEKCRELDVMIAAKLHAAVFSACAYTPFVVVEYRPKCLDFADSISYTSYNVRTDVLSVPVVLKYLDEIKQNQEQITLHLHNQVVNYKKILTNYLANIIRA